MSDLRTFKIELHCRSPFLTPWRSCTLWGRLAWLVARGMLPEWTIQDWVKAHLAGPPPLIVSDGFPDGFVPVPAAFLAQASGTEKKLSALDWPQWKQLCSSGDWPKDARKPKVRGVERMHVSIDRERGTAADGQLRTESGEWPETIVIIALVGETLGKTGLEQLFRALCNEGWGYGRTYGYGHIDLVGIETIAVPLPTGSVATLGHCHPTADMPEKGCWRWRGVPGLRHDPATQRAVMKPNEPEEKTRPDIQFTSMLAPGACFAYSDQVPQHIGMLLPRDIPQGEDKPVHCGQVPVWPIKISEDGNA